MLLNELFPGKNTVRAVAITQRHQHEHEHKTHKKPDMTLDELSDILGIDQRDVLDLVSQQKGPLKNVISAIENGKVVWYNEDNDEASDDATVQKKQEDNADLVSNKAKQQAKKDLK